MIKLNSFLSFLLFFNLIWDFFNLVINRMVEVIRWKFIEFRSQFGSGFGDFEYFEWFRFGLDLAQVCPLEDILIWQSDFLNVWLVAKLIQIVSTRDPAVLPNDWFFSFECLWIHTLCYVFHRFTRLGTAI